MDNKYEKVYAKVFKISNKEGTFTKDDFKLFKEKFELIRFFYYDENVDRDSYVNFGELIGEIKRAAWGAGCKAELLEIKYDSCITKSGLVYDGHYIEDVPQYSIILGNDTDFEYNLIVFFKYSENYEEKKSFVITKIDAYEEDRVCKACNNIVIIIDKDGQDSTDLSYKYTWRK